MPEEVTIRSARPGELPELSALLDLLFEIEQDFKPDTARQVAGLKLMLDSPMAELLVAELGGRPVGLCGLQLLVSTAQGAYSCHVEDLVLAPECRGRGIGRLLLEAAAEWAHRRGATRMQLNCDDKNLPAMKFYESLGWRKTHLFNYFKLDF